MDSAKARARISRLAGHLDSGAARTAGSSFSAKECSAFIRRDTMLLFARQGSDACGRFMRPAEAKQMCSVKETEHVKETKSVKHSEEHIVYGKQNEEKKACDEAPLFARTVSKWDAVIHVKSSTETSGIEWSPRMDVVESGSEHVVIIELPGVNVDDIRVEIERGKLIVSGIRSSQWWRNPENDLSSVHGCKDDHHDQKIYYRRDLSYGPYRAVWTLPKNANFNGATAEFIDGFLRVVVPKK